MEPAIATEIRALGQNRSNYSATLPSGQLWRDRRSLRVLGLGSALPGPPVATADLLARIENRFQVDVLRRRAALGSRLGIDARHLWRDFDQRLEAPRPGNSNPDLAASALQAALDDADLTVGDLAYIVGYTATPACLIPPNVALVAERVSFAGPYMELRQACTGFANN